MDHIYHAAITINKGQKYGMSPEKSVYSVGGTST